MSAVEDLRRGGRPRKAASGRTLATGLVSGLVVSVVATAVWAQSPRDLLPAEACRMISGQVADLEATGIQAVFDMGPEWAKQNASQEQIDGVAKLIALREQLRFSCPVGFDNQVVAAIRGEAGSGPPPLPVRLPEDRRAERTRLAASEAAARSGVVPLPVRKPQSVR